MVDSVQGTNLIQQVRFQQNNIQKPQQKVTSPEEKPQQTEVASSAASAASAAYATPQIKSTKPQALEDYIAKLQKEGKVEGKDYKIEKDEEYTDVTEFNKNNNKESKVSVWKNIDGKLEYMGSEEYSYNGDRKICTDMKDHLGRLEAHTHHYYNDEISQATISHDGLTYQTKTDDYIKNLRNKGVKYTDQIEKDGNWTMHIVEEYDENNKQTMKTVWATNSEKPACNYISRDLLRTDGTVSTSVVYTEDKTNVVNFFNMKK